jgi:outer membrane receptor protein involved in Fe transport
MQISRIKNVTSLTPSRHLPHAFVAPSIAILRTIGTGIISFWLYLLILLPEPARAQACYKSVNNSPRVATMKLLWTPSVPTAPSQITFQPGNSWQDCISNGISANLTLDIFTQFDKGRFIPTVHGLVSSLTIGDNPLLAQPGTYQIIARPTPAPRKPVATPTPIPVTPVVPGGPVSWNGWLSGHKWKYLQLGDQNAGDCDLRSIRVALRDDGEAKFYSLIHTRHTLSFGGDVWHTDLDLGDGRDHWHYGRFSSPHVSNGDTKVFPIDFNWKHADSKLDPRLTYDEIKVLLLSFNKC